MIRLLAWVGGVLAAVAVATGVYVTVRYRPDASGFRLGVQRLHGSDVKLQKRLATSAHDITACPRMVSALPGFGYRRSQISCRTETAPTRAVGTEEVRIAKLAYGAMPVLLAPRP